MTRPLEHHLAHDGEGPSEECFRSGQSVRCDDLRAGPPRWPRFNAASVRLGFVAVDAVPMRLRSEVIGTLNLFRTSPDALPPRRRRWRSRSRTSRRSAFSRCARSGGTGCSRNSCKPHSRATSPSSRPRAC
ncbi:GAF domain-containing protein [Lentzea sp. NPDC042327]|uniref:GAF domain-containing protein n=1 Tax=Lentzea sp. NPDC042327 TaxID=3154801 RepID=UPI0033D0B94B